MKAEGDGGHARLAFRLNTGDMVTAGPDNPLRLAHGDDGPRPYLRVRGGLDALIARPIFYDLAERALAGGDTPAGVWSDGAFFARSEEHTSELQSLMRSSYAVSCLKKKKKQQKPRHKT